MARAKIYNGTSTRKGKKKTSNISKEQQKGLREASTVKQKELKTAIDDLLDAQTTTIQKISEDHHRSQEYVAARIGHGVSQQHTSRAANSWNGWVKEKCDALNAGE